ncbi:MAG: MGMT family protein [Aestuariivita sp.]|nr:MGMT family protein [Aestuariivita sp.]
MMNQKDRSQYILNLVKEIDYGTVRTYGDIANEVYGDPASARGVASAIKKKAQIDCKNFPWWRVVDRKLKPTQAKPGARELLEDEGVNFTQNGEVAD